MKDITSKINEGWEFNKKLSSTDKGVDIEIPKGAKWLLINTETETIAAVTKKDLDSFAADFDDEETGPAVKKLKIGESYDADGGINIYIRIRK